MAGEYIVKAATKGEMFISLSILTCINFLQMFSGRLQHLPEFKFKFKCFKVLKTVQDAFLHFFSMLLNGAYASKFETGWEP
jgi:hypothetical protein